MEKYDQILFANRIPGTVKIPGGLNLECPYCLEGSSRGFKKRGFLLWSDPQKENVMYYCHNCSVAGSLKTLLYDKYNYLYDDYVSEEKQYYLDRLKSGQLKNKKVPILETHNDGSVEFPPELDLLPIFKPIRENPEAFEYCKKRLVPDGILKNMLVSPVTVLDENGNVAPFSDMAIFPFLNGKKMYGFQGRSYTSKFFHTKVPNGFKIYNFYNVDRHNTVYITESILDMLYSSNFISSLGSDIAEHFLKHLDDPVFCFDNDKTGLKKSLKYVERGYKVFCWPLKMKYKDLNAALTSGEFTRPGLFDLIKENIFDGWEAEVNINLKLNMK